MSDKMDEETGSNIAMQEQNAREARLRKSGTYRRIGGREKKVVLGTHEIQGTSRTTSGIELSSADKKAMHDIETIGKDSEGGGTIFSELTNAATNYNLDNMEGLESAGDDFKNNMRGIISRRSEQFTILTEHPNLKKDLELRMTKAAGLEEDENIDLSDYIPEEVAA